MPEKIFRKNSGTIVFWFSWLTSDLEITLLAECP